MDHSQLQQVEQLCTALYSGSNAQMRADAQQTLLTLTTSAEHIPKCQFILDNSQLSFAQVTASTTLESLITQFWTNFSLEQKLELRNYVLNYLYNHTHNLQEFVIGSLTKLASRITKLGWFDSTEHRDIVEETAKFLDASVEHLLVGMKLLNSLVDEMNTPTPGRTLTVHRKTAVSFRDHALLNAFQLSIQTLKQNYSGLGPAQEAKVSHASLSLATACLSFDFIGTNPEESAEDVGTVQVPSSWRAVVQDTATMQLFFDRYSTSEPPQSSMALQALVQLSSVRRSLFSSEKERTVFLQSLMTNIQTIMTTKQGLQEEENYHEFCRLLGRLKASYQLSELVKTVGFMEWLELAGDFTVKSLQNWQYSMNSIHYLLALWGRLVAALPYLRADAVDSQRPSNSLRQCVLQVAESYITTMLDSVEIVVNSNGSIEDPLDDEGSLKEQMDRLPVIARLQYETVAQYLISQFEQSLSLYEQRITAGNMSGNSRDLKVLEGRMTWLTYMVASVIGAQTAAEPRKGQSDLLWDGRLSKCVFLLVQLLDYRLSASSGQGKCDPKLEIAVLNYFRSFKKSFVLDVTSTSSISSIVPGGSPAHPLLSLALSYSGGIGRDVDSDKTGGDNITIYDIMALGDVTTIMNIIVNKICSNIKYWHRSDIILAETLDVFVELVTSFGSNKTLLGLDTVAFLVQNHVGSHFPFLGYDVDSKYRITFYSALSRLVFSSSEDLNNQFDMFIVPNVEILVQLSQTAELRHPHMKLAIIGALRDLRGITSSTYNKRTYNLLFDAIYPVAFPLLTRVAEAWYDDATVMTALFKFMQEFVTNKGQRIQFEQSSASGILLFRETSFIICAYGSHILQVPVQQDIYLEKYKGIRLMLNTLAQALSGGYVNFGVFALYNDQALQNALDVSLQTCLQIPTSDVMQYIKLSRAYYAFLEVLFRNHLDVLCGLDSSVFIQLVNANHDGLQSSDVTISALCASAIDHLATYIFLNLNRDKPTVNLIKQHIASEPELLNNLMTTLFNTLLFTSHANHWAVTRPILSLLLASDHAFVTYQNQLISSQIPENQDKLREEFTKLTNDVQRSVEAANRDRFTQKLTMFRLNVRVFLTL